MNYIQYTFTVNPPEPGTDILIALLADLGFESFTTTNTGFEAYIQKEADDESRLADLAFDDFSYHYTRQEIETQNWNKTWEENFSPVYVDDLCCIRAHFHEKPAHVKHDIIITPKMSFGTGHHDTTWLMCKTMFGLNMSGQRVLDMGCGTGVLAILAAKLGATDIDGIDIDDWSIENSVENAEINQCAHIRFAKGDAALLIGKAPYNIVLANINKNVLRKDMPVYAGVMKPGAQLLLSGFFTVDVAELRDVAEKAGLTWVASYSKNEWAVIHLKK
ncbi:MAG: 50S ribosomal protein L11 methyltransferase [Bacteroidetes bacterium]|nr:50S ribosomal protein L11 methyltransferase [Bacteroidota bacterium]